jgi:cytochrome c-type biogenesis protein CcmE
VHTGTVNKLSLGGLVHTGTVNKLSLGGLVHTGTVNNLSLGGLVHTGTINNLSLGGLVHTGTVNKLSLVRKPYCCLSGPNAVSLTLLHRFLLLRRFHSSLRYNDVDLSPGWGSPLDRGQRLGVSK